MRDFKPAKQRIEVSVGESVRIMRELQEMSQSQLATAAGIPQSQSPHISAIENGHTNLGVERAKRLAKSPEMPPSRPRVSGMGRPTTTQHKLQGSEYTP